MNPQHSSYSPYRIECIGKPSLVHNGVNCVFLHRLLLNFIKAKSFLHDEFYQLYDRNYRDKKNLRLRQKGRRIRSVRYRTGILKKPFVSTGRDDGSPPSKDEGPPLVLCQNKHFSRPSKTNFLSREFDPPGVPPWSSRLSNNSQTRIVPFTNRLVDDPLGKEAERETKIIRRYQICH